MAQRIRLGKASEKGTRKRMQDAGYSDEAIEFFLRLSKIVEELNENCVKWLKFLTEWDVRAKFCYQGSTSLKNPDTGENIHCFTCIDADGGLYTSPEPCE
jgi:hypothetical protein